MVTLKFKDELGGTPIEEFVDLPEWNYEDTEMPTSPFGIN